MDLLQKCAVVFKHLLSYKYHFMIGCKGKMLTFTLDFNKADFHRLTGLHKLRDNACFLIGKRTDVYNGVLDGKLTYAQVKQGVYFSEIGSRLELLASLESFLGSNEIVLRFNEKIQKFSLIKTDYLLENRHKDSDVYLSLAQRAGTETQVCRSFFPKQESDYTVGQPRYTLLKKEKANTRAGIITTQYDRLTPLD